MVIGRNNQKWEIGCLGVQCYSISLGTFSRNNRCIALFTTGWNESILDKKEKVYGEKYE